MKMLERLLERAEIELPRISVGVASYPQHGEVLETLMEHADQAMYRSKAAGGTVSPCLTHRPASLPWRDTDFPFA